MEGPSLVLLTEELKPFVKTKVTAAEGTADIAFDKIPGTSLKKALSWGKHLILVFDKTILRIHFLMFGSYRINESKDRDPKLRLSFKDGFVDFYSCSVKTLSKEDLKAYDWSLDLMSDEWDKRRVTKLLREKDDGQLCDLLMDQTIFPGLGNIIKNEVLFRLRFHPEWTLDQLKPKEQLALVREARNYSLQFYEWKKINQLKRNWLIFRKRKCPICKGAVTMKKTGKGQRVSFFCPKCQARKRL